MISAPTYNIKGEKLPKTSLPKNVFGVVVSPTLIAQAVRVYLSNQRKAVAKTITRGEMTRTTAKMYKQKGTGRARHGSYSAPVFVGGGIAHGPTGTQNYKLKMARKPTRLAMLGTLTTKASDGRVIVLAGGDGASGKTLEAARLLNKIGTKHGILVVVKKGQDKLEREWRNLSRVNVVKNEALNTYEIYAHEYLVVSKEALEAITKKYAD